MPETNTFADPATWPPPQVLGFINTLRVVRRTVLNARQRNPRNRPWTAVRFARLFRPRLSNPVFVVGSPRSGTTFLGSCFAQVPSISYHFEPVATKAAARAVALGDWPEWKGRLFFRFVYRTLMRIHSEGDLRFCEKTPRLAFLMPFLTRTFPEVQFVHIIRDGRDVAASLLKKPWHLAASAATGRYEPGGHPYGPFPHFWVPQHEQIDFAAASDAYRCAWVWQAHTQAAMLFGRTLPASRYMEVRYEDLAFRTHEVASNILSFLGIDQPEDQDAFHEACSKITQSSVGRGSDELTANQMADVIRRAGNLLDTLGYVETSLTQSAHAAQMSAHDHTPSP